jgi:hypothetical protein
MNRISSKDYLIKCRRGARRPDSLEYLHYVQGNRVGSSTIHVALIDSRRPRTTNTLSLFNAKQGPPGTGLALPRELGKLCIDVCKRRGIGGGPMNRKLPKRFERGVRNEA